MQVDDGFDRANGYRTRSIMAFPLKNYGGQVIGVVQDAMHVNAFADLWVPVSTDPSSDYRTQMWGDYTALIMARERLADALREGRLVRVRARVEHVDRRARKGQARLRLGQHERRLVATAVEIRQQQ